MACYVSVVSDVYLEIKLDAALLQTSKKVNQISQFHKASKRSWSNERKEESSRLDYVICARWRCSPSFAKKVMNLDDNKYINSAAQSIIMWVVKNMNKIPLSKTGARD